MSTTINRMIDELETAIISYKKDKRLLKQYIEERNKFQNEVDNYMNTAFLQDEDELDNLKARLATANNTYYYIRESVETKLYALQFKAYKLGRTRSKDEDHCKP